MSLCAGCGKEIPENARYCLDCKPGDTREATEQHTNRMAVASLVTGIIGIFLIPVIFSVLAIIFGRVGMKQASQQGVRGRGMAVTGLALGISGLALWIILMIVWYG